MKGVSHPRSFPGIPLLALLMALATAVPAQQAPSAPASTNAPAAALAGEAGNGNAEDGAQSLLAEAERKRGPSFPGKDPAFLVLPRPADRPDMSRLLTPRAREIRDRALDYLSKAQGGDGSWSDRRYPANTGVSALACLAFMSEGSRAKMGVYGKQIDLGIEALLQNAESGGIIAGRGSNPAGPMYEHCFSMLVLIFSLGDMPHRPQARETVARGLLAILRSQKPDGGWRYAMSSAGDSDVSVTGQVLWVLRSAKKSGFSVPPEAIVKGMRFVESCALPDNSFRYRPAGIVTVPAPAGPAILSLGSAGRLDHPLIGLARERVAHSFARYPTEDIAARRYAVYGCFVSSFAMYACGDAYYVPFYQKTTEVFGRLQRPDGDIPDEFENTVYPTAMALIVLQSPLGYLPIYER